ncbi:MAG TPA: hypothetical protein VNQ77_10340 [Frankiaceae bacterium]|nr:hypothetical protein [Frankiaceae bacterium]
MYELDAAVTAPARLRAGLGFVFWGMLLVALDFRVQDVDVLPDLVGWVLIATGSARLMGQTSDGAYERRAGAAWVVSLGAALLSVGDLAAALPHPLGLVYVILAVSHPILLAAAMLRLATLADAEDERRSWNVSLSALVLSTVVAATIMAGFATGGSEMMPVWIVAILFSVAALLHYLVSLQRSRKALGAHDVGGRVLGATPDDVSRGVTSAPRPSA